VWRFDIPEGERLIQQDDGTNPAPIGWQTSALNNSGSTKTLKVAVVCAQTEFTVFLPLVIK
jgi:hypothetical protein